MIFAEPKLNPKDDKTGIRITPAHIIDKGDFLRSMLVKVVMRPSGAVAKRSQRAIKTFFPTVDILTGNVKFPDSVGNAIRKSKLNKR